MLPRINFSIIAYTYKHTFSRINLPESVFTKTLRGSAFALGGPSGFESTKELLDPMAALCPAQSFSHLWCLPKLLIFAICECLDIPFILLEEKKKKRKKDICYF